MPGNRSIWELWCAVSTQWRAGGMGVIGLDYGLTMKIAALMRIPWTPALFKKIRILEEATLKRMRTKVNT